MKAKPLKLVGNIYKPCNVDEATHIKLHMHGHFENRFIPVVKGFGSVWTWNKDTEKPTIYPSIKTFNNDYICHSWIKDGKVQYLNDSTHKYSGKTVDLLEVE